MLNKPYDLAVIFAIIAVIVVTIGFGVNSVITDFGVDADTTYFDNVESQVTSSTGLKGTSDDASEGITGDEGATEDASEDSILVGAFKSLLKLGQTYKLVEDSMDEGFAEIGIDPIYIIIVMSTVIIIFAVTLYSFFTGR